MLDIQANVLLLEKARKAIKKHGQSTNTKRPEVDWTLTELDTPQFLGVHNKALMFAEDGRYVVHVYEYGSGAEILSGSYKTLVAALRNGRMYANSNYARRSLYTVKEA